MRHQQFLESIESLRKWRYLDVLDSLRFDSESDRNNIPRRIFHAQMELYITLLMGHGVVVSNNQLFDSSGFFSNISRLIKDSYINKSADLLPLRFSLFDYKKNYTSPFEIAASRIALEGFHLSSWKHLNKDMERRKLWAEQLFNKDLLPYDETKYFVNSNEYHDFLDLYRVLGFFDEHPLRITKAEEIGNARTDLIMTIARMNPKDEEDLIKDLDDDQIDQVKDLKKVFSNLEKIAERLDNRSLLLDLVENNESCYAGVSNSAILYELKNGVMVCIDSLYNHTNFIGTKADLDHISIETSNKTFKNGAEPEDHQSEITKKWDYYEAAFMLAVWARKKYNREKGKIFPGDIASYGDEKLSLNIPEEKLKLFVEQFDWQKFLDNIPSSNWVDSAHTYLKALHKYEVAKEKQLYFFGKNEITQTITDYFEYNKKNYEEKRNNHVDWIKEFILHDNEDIESTRGNLQSFVVKSRNDTIFESPIENYSQNPDNALDYAKTLSSDDSLKTLDNEFGQE